VPASDRKPEGTHGTGWVVDADPAQIAMPADRVSDAAVFDPEATPPSPNLASLGCANFSPTAADLGRTGIPPKVIERNPDFSAAVAAH